MKKIAYLIAIAFAIQSCGVTLPAIRKTNVNSNIVVNDAASQIEPLKFSEYKVLKSTEGKAVTNRFYFLFIPLGKMKSETELYENAYYDAVSNCDSADAIILPMRKNKKLTIPLLIVNYQRKEVVVKGVAVQVKR